MSRVGGTKNCPQHHPSFAGEALSRLTIRVAANPSSIRFHPSWAPWRMSYTLLPLTSFPNQWNCLSTTFFRCTYRPKVGERFTV